MVAARVVERSIEFTSTDVSCGRSDCLGRHTHCAPTQGSVRDNILLRVASLRFLLLFEDAACSITIALAMAYRSSNTDMDMR